MVADEGRGTNFIMVLNNYTEEQHEALKAWIVKHCKKGIIAQEVAPTTGTPHLQCAFSTKNRSVKLSSCIAAL